MLERPLACAASPISAAPCAPETAGATRGLWGGALVGTGFERFWGKVEDNTRSPPSSCLLRSQARTRMQRDQFNPSAASTSGSGLYKAGALMSTSPWSQWQGGWEEERGMAVPGFKLCHSTQAAYGDREAPSLRPSPFLPTHPRPQFPSWGFVIEAQACQRPGRRLPPPPHVPKERNHGVKRPLPRFYR